MSPRRTADPSQTSDPRALDRLLARRPATTIHWGLDRIRFMLDALGRPHESFRSIHVAGTNGKGTAAATAESILRRAGFRTGLYTSPHLVAFSERIRVLGRPIAPPMLEAAANDVLPLADEADATFFEAVTALGFLCFARAGVDVGVVEVGLGGRLDATNVLSAPVCVITSIDLDHADHLGADLAGIATEKAGILSPGATLVTGPLSETAARAIDRAAVSSDAITWRAGEGFTVDPGDDGSARFRGGPRDRRLELRPPFPGAHQAWNAAVAIVAVDAFLAVGEGLASHAAVAPRELSDEAVAAAVAEVEWPGRFDVRRHADGTWMYDLAHNPAAAVALASAMRTSDLPRPLVLLASVLGDKDWEDTLAPLLEVTDAAVLSTAPSAPAERQWNLDRVRQRLAPTAAPDRVVEPDFGAALARARERAGPAGTVVVTGSAFTVGDALRFNASEA